MVTLFRYVGLRNCCTGQLTSFLFGIGTSEECLNSGSWYSNRGWPASETDTLNSERVCVNKVA